MRLILNGLFGLLLSVAIGCTDKMVNCTLTLDDLMLHQGNKKLTTFTIKGEVRKVINIGVDSTSGVYSFYKNGNLQHYRFFVNSKAYTYSEEYDEDGRCIKIEGNPLVYNNIELKTDDSIYFELYFMDLNKKYDKVNITTNSDQNFDLTLKNDSIFTNMKYASFGLNRKGQNHIRVYISTEYQVKCDSAVQILRDTIALGYIPPKDQ